MGAVTDLSSSGRAPERARPMRRRDIDGLRAVAVTLVMVFHAVPKQLSGGFIGVDVFFVISGYLITGLILGEHERQPFSFGGFYSRRIRRIFPPLIVVLATSGVLGILFLPASALEPLGLSIVSGALFIPNLVLHWRVAYFDGALPVNPIGHLWSLGVEEQFYLVWPLILAVLWRRRQWLAPGIALVSAASFVLCVWLTGTDSGAAFYLPVSRLWELGLGGLLSLAVPISGGGLPWMTRERATSSSALGFVLLGASAVLIGPLTPFPGAVALVPVTGTLLILAAGERSWINQRILTLPAFVGLGLISYSLYLWHHVLLMFAEIEAGERLSPAVALTLVALSVPVAWLSYRFVELPSQARLASRAGTIGLLVAMAVVALGGLILFQVGG